MIGVRWRPFLLALPALIGGPCVFGLVHAAEFVPPPRFEMTSWMLETPDSKVRADCVLTGETVSCRSNPSDFEISQDRRFQGRRFSYRLHMIYTSPAGFACRVKLEHAVDGLADLLEGGKLTFSNQAGVTRVLSASGKCGPQPAATTFPAAAGVGVWSAGDAGEQPGFGESALRTSLWQAVGQAEGPLARKCFDDTMSKLNEPRNAGMRERLEAAAYQQYVIDKLAAAAGADDFDAQWSEAARAIGGPGGRAQELTDRAVRLLPEPLRRIVEIARRTYRLSVGVNEQALAPKLKGRLFEVYRDERRNRPNEPAAEVLRDASARVGGWEKIKTDLRRQFPGATDAARETAMFAYLGARFDFVHRAREAAENREKRIAEVWASVASDVARFRTTLLDCMTK